MSSTDEGGIEKPEQSAPPPPHAHEAYARRQKEAGLEIIIPPIEVPGYQPKKGTRVHEVLALSTNRKYIRNLYLKGLGGSALEIESKNPAV